MTPHPYFFVSTQIYWSLPSGGLRNYEDNMYKSGKIGLPTHRRVFRRPSRHGAAPTYDHHVTQHLFTDPSGHHDHTGSYPVLNAKARSAIPPQTSSPHIHKSLTIALGTLVPFDGASFRKGIPTNSNRIQTILKHCLPRVPAQSLTPSHHLPLKV